MSDYHCLDNNIGILLLDIQTHLENKKIYFVITWWVYDFWLFEVDAMRY